jgi:hypothetical protein
VGGGGRRAAGALPPRRPRLVAGTAAAPLCPAAWRTRRERSHRGGRRARPTARRDGPGPRAARDRFPGAAARLKRPDGASKTLQLARPRPPRPPGTPVQPRAGPPPRARRAAHRARSPAHCSSQPAEARPTATARSPSPSSRAGRLIVLARAWQGAPSGMRRYITPRKFCRVRRQCAQGRDRARAQHCTHPGDSAAPLAHAWARVRAPGLALMAVRSALIPPGSPAAPGRARAPGGQFRPPATCRARLRARPLSWPCARRPDSRRPVPSLAECVLPMTSPPWGPTGGGARGAAGGIVQSWRRRASAAQSRRRRRGVAGGRAGGNWVRPKRSGYTHPAGGSSSKGKVFLRGGGKWGTGGSERAGWPAGRPPPGGTPRPLSHRTALGAACGRGRRAVQGRRAPPRPWPPGPDASLWPCRRRARGARAPARPRACVPCVRPLT